MTQPLANQLLQQYRQLLDKPVSQKSISQLHTLLKHPSLPIYKALLSTLDKCRSDLIIFILSQNLLINQTIYHKPITQSQKYILENILFKNFIKYKIQDVILIWKIILLKYQKNNYQQAKEFKIKYAYQQVLKQAVKVTDLQKKDALFNLLNQNIKLLWGQGSKQIIITISNSYFRVFQKMIIYQPYFVSVIKTLLEIFTQNRQNKLSEKQQIQQQKNYELLPDISQQNIYMITKQIQTILINSSPKPFHSLHRQCLNTLTIIADKYATYKSNQNIQYQHVKNIANQILRCVQAYLYRKPVRDQARKAQQTWRIVENGLQIIHSQKMEKIKQSVILNLMGNNKLQQQNDKPILIENILQKANKYQQKYQTPIIDKERYMGKSSLFLKKGQGVGGGKALLQQSPKKGQYKQRRYEQIVQNCINGTQQSKVKLPSKNSSQIDFIIQTQLNNAFYSQNKQIKKLYGKQKQIRSYFNGKNQIMNKKEDQTQYQLNQNNLSSSTFIQQDQQFQQICNLIDLAYSYKFSSKENY